MRHRSINKLKLSIWKIMMTVLLLSLVRCLSVGIAHQFRFIKCFFFQSILSHSVTQTVWFGMARCICYYTYTHTTVIQENIYSLTKIICCFFLSFNKNSKICFFAYDELCNSFCLSFAFRSFVHYVPAKTTSLTWLLYISFHNCVFFSFLITLFRSFALSQNKTKIN